MVLLTIGTSNRSEAEFFDPLIARHVSAIVDVRSKPWSRLRYFTGASLAETGPLHGMRYLWMGDVLGGMNDIATDDPAFLAALDQLLMLEASGPIAVFCAEGAPTECHRCYKLGAALLVHREVDAVNVLRDGREEPVTRTLLRTRADSIPPCVRGSAIRISMHAAAT